ncbi:MAG: hypothetical protein IIA30_03825 [Myxococcales bacterium]|nr:hypothetical protein [Myxococcales bacterium]
MSLTDPIRADPDDVMSETIGALTRRVEHCGVAVALMDRPWNHDLAQLPHETASAIAGCLDWREVAARFASP